MSLAAPPCPHLWTPPCECPLGPFHRPACAWFNPGLDPAPLGCPCEGDAEEPGPHALGCPWGDPDYGPTVTDMLGGPSELDCPPEHGCLADEYDWLCGTDDPELWPDGCG